MPVTVLIASARFVLQSSGHGSVSYGHDHEHDQHAWSTQVFLDNNAMSSDKK